MNTADDRLWADFWILNSDSRQTLIRRKPGKRYLPFKVQEIDYYSNGSLMVWTGIALDLYVLERGAVRYREEVLELYVCLFVGEIGSDSV
ncbi:DDE_3 domain-containing protein [Trichonephila clavipes]|uniref:DDE_3 domain-containing protein n=1 Tax=Trichonephila clavipes TaxID=2585209 RepID=A0A8X6T1M7_TRICX|nr:DDE_3 domain-containing protein [Trichonephila clavipes]